MLKYFLISKYLRKRALILLSAGGMAVTVMVFIVVFSVLDGFGLGISDRLRGTKADIIVQDISGRSLPEYEAVMREIEDEVAEVEACAPYIERYAMFEWMIMEYEYKPDTGTLALAGRRIGAQPQYGIIRGIDPEREAEVGKLARFLEDGGFFETNPDATLADILVPGSNNVIVGQRFRLPPEFGIGPSDSKRCEINGMLVPLDTFDGETDLDKMRAAVKRHPYAALQYSRIQISSIKTGDPDFEASGGFTVKGRFRTGENVFDERVILMHYKDAQKLLGMYRRASTRPDLIPAQPATVSGISVKLKPGTDEHKLAEIKAKITAILQRRGAKCSVRGWREIDEKILEALAVEKAVTFIILTCIFVAMGAGVFVIQWFSVVRHTRDIGILKAIGVNNRGVMCVFFGLSLTIGLVGAAVGLMLGIIVAANVNEILFFIERTTGWSLFPRDLFTYERIPAVIDINIYLVIAGGAVLICALAGLLPAISAARRDPAKCLVVE